MHPAMLAAPAAGKQPAAAKAGTRPEQQVRGQTWGRARAGPGHRVKAASLGKEILGAAGRTGVSLARPASPSAEPIFGGI